MKDIKRKLGIAYIIFLVWGIPIITAIFILTQEFTLKQLLISFIFLQVPIVITLLFSKFKDIFDIEGGV